MTCSPTTISHIPSKVPKDTRAYKDYPSAGGLFLQYPQDIRLKQTLIRLWQQHILTPLQGHRVECPILVPQDVLRQSGHLQSFGDEIFTTGSLALRPQTAQSIFANYKTLRWNLKGSPLVVGQVGHSFRNEKTTRTSRLRMKEFYQLQVELFHPSTTDLTPRFAQCLHRAETFFRAAGFPPLTLVQVPEGERPHYSRKTVDLYCYGVELGCVNDRGDYDLAKRGHPGVITLQVSLGLSRMMTLMQDHGLTPT